MNDMRFDPLAAQPARQPEPIAAGFERHDNALDGLACLDSFISPAMQQPEQDLRVGGDFLHVFTLDARNDSAY